MSKIPTPGNARYVVYALALTLQFLGGGATTYLTYREGYLWVAVALGTLTGALLTITTFQSDRPLNDLILAEHHRIAHDQDVLAAALTEEQARKVADDRRTRFNE